MPRDMSAQPMRIPLRRRIKTWSSEHALSALLAARVMAFIGAVAALRFRLTCWRYCHVSWTARITGWKGMTLGRNVVISRGCWLNVNDRTSGAVSLRVMDNTFIGEGNLLAVGRRLIFREYGITGPNCAFLASSHITTDPMRPYSASGVTASDDIYVGVNCYFGHGCSVIGNVKIGHGSIVGAGSVVRGDLPPFSVAVGNPAAVIKHFDFASSEWIKGPPPSGRAVPSEEDYLQTLKATIPFPLQPISGAPFFFGDA